MKYETKYKIIKFVKWLIHYKEFDHAPYMIKEERKVEIIRSYITMPVREEKMMTQDQIEYTLGMGLLHELQRGKFVKYERTELAPAFDEPMVEILASLRVIQP